MTVQRDTESRYKRSLETLKRRGQEHILRWWEHLDALQRDLLLTDIESLPWDLLDEIIPTHVQNRPDRQIPKDLAPPKVYSQPPQPGEEAVYEQAAEHGRNLIHAGKVAAFTVAGGQGTRLGFDGPKGAMPVTPVGGRTLFELFAKAIWATRRRYDAVVPWYIMTSPANHGQTVEFFRQNRFFGLPESEVTLFSQGTLPAFDFQGRLLLEAKHRLALAPDGHGGSLKALVTYGALADMRSRGVEIISYFQVDNALVKPVDPLFVGLHATTGSEMSSKVTPKADDFERVGVLCMADGKLTLIEYTEFPPALAVARNSDESRTFDAGNPAIHALDVAFVDRVIAQSFEMPVRRADKIAAFIDDTGSRAEPTEPNAVKLETFVFDALPLAKSPLLLEVDRAEEFSPLKNPTGVDSLVSSQRDQVRRACRWLERAGVTVPRKADGEPDVTIVISPSFALDAAELKSKIDLVPPLKPGDAIYIE